jgi:hypothetical protein
VRSAPDEVDVAGVELAEAASRREASPQAATNASAETTTRVRGMELRLV